MRPSSIVLGLVALVMGCGAAPALAPAPATPKTSAAAPPAALSMPSTQAIVVRSEGELASTGFTVDPPVSFDAVSLILIVGTTTKALPVDATGGSVVLDRQTGALVSGDPRTLARPQTLTLDVGAEAITIVQHTTFTRDCPPSPFDPLRGFPLNKPISLPPTLAIAVRREAASLPLRWLVAMRTVDPICPLFIRPLAAVGDPVP